MKKIKERNKGGFAFIGEKWLRFALLVCVITIVLICQKVYSMQYLLAQKSVQEGDLSQWHTYLDKSIKLACASIIVELILIFSQMWIVKTQKINFFQRYRDVIQQEGHFKLCQIQFEFANAKVNTLIGVIMAIISIVYTFCMFHIVEMTVPIKIGAAMIFFAGVSFGILRGILQQKADAIGADISSKQQLLSNFFMISDYVLNVRLWDIDKEYWQQITCQIIKNFFRLLPTLIQATCFIAFMWNVTESMVKGNETVYSYSYIVLTAYGFVVTLANDFGNIIEDVTKLYKYSKSSEISFLNNEEDERNKLLDEQEKNVVVEEKAIVVKKDFTANVTRPDGEEAYYYVPEELKIQKGQMVSLDGQNGTGKTRFNQLLKMIIPDVISYNTRTSMSNIVIENFRGSTYPIDYSLIIRLANGLGLKRVPNTCEAINALVLDKQINGADRQLLLALQILYFAIKEHQKNPNKIQMIILDEILGNVSPENASRVIGFMKNELEKIGACTLVVSHSHKEEVAKNVTKTWQMENEGEKIVIKEK